MRVTLRRTNEELADISVIMDDVKEIHEEGGKLVAVHESGAKLVSEDTLEISVEESKKKMS